jgi:hypothetical protein
VIRFASLAGCRGRTGDLDHSATEGRSMCGCFEVRLPEPAEWFDLWHTHVDWRGAGNGSPEVRRECTRALFVALERVAALVASRSGPWQSWLLFDPADAGQDAVYLHTPNPNRENFPYQFEDVIWGAVPPAWLAEFVTEDLEVGRSEFEGAELYWIRHRSGADPAALPDPPT